MLRGLSPAICMARLQNRYLRRYGIRAVNFSILVENTGRTYDQVKPRHRSRRHRSCPNPTKFNEPRLWNSAQSPLLQNESISQVVRLLPSHSVERASQLLWLFADV